MELYKGTRNEERAPKKPRVIERPDGSCVYDKRDVWINPVTGRAVLANRTYGDKIKGFPGVAKKKPKAGCRLPGRGEQFAALDSVMESCLTSLLILETIDSSEPKRAFQIISLLRPRQPARVEKAMATSRAAVMNPDLVVTRKMRERAHRQWNYIMDVFSDKFVKPSTPQEPKPEKSNGYFGTRKF